MVKNAFSWGLHFSAYAFAQEKLLTMVKNAFSWGSNGRVPKSGVSKHFSHLKEVRLFPKI